jgi:acyl-CoA thioesterase-1
LRGLPPQVTRENITAMLDILKQRNIPTILSAVQAPANLGEDYRVRFNAIYTDAAKTYGVPLYPFLLSETFSRNELMQADGVHPNATGAQHIADSLAKYFKQWAPMRGRIQKQ